MGGFLWLVWYEPSTRTSARHWALAVTYEAHEQAYATFYEMIGDGTPGRPYQSRVARRVHLTSRHNASAYAGKILLGEVIDDVLGALEMYSETAADLVTAHNQKRAGGREYTSQDWAIIIVSSLEDALLLPKGSLARVERCPK